MLALEITSMKQFMNHLLAADTFDIFLLEEAVISTANTFTIDGHINREFYGEYEQEIPADTAGHLYEFRPWKELRSMVFDLIKGKHTPVFFRFVLHLAPEKAAALLESRGCEVAPDQIRALVLNIRYDGSKAILTTGTAYHTFLLSKEPDMIWDKALLQYLDQKAIPYTLP